MALDHFAPVVSSVSSRGITNAGVQGVTGWRDSLEGNAHEYSR